MSWHPDGWGEDSPWMRLFRNARVRVGLSGGYRLISTACVVTQYFASMLAFSHFGREAGSFR